MPSTTITSKGQVTIPKKVRETLGVHQGDRLVFDIWPDGRITVAAERPQPVTRLLRRLAAYQKDRPVSVDQMNAAVRRRAADRHRKSRGE
ncbi:MAG: AbrB/MazE/SpoVT family DNA-binding domain-containing protein [Thermoanaerobaculia bacterium]